MERSFTRAVFRDVPQLIAATGAYLAAHNAYHPKPCVWTASARGIMEKVKRGGEKLVDLQSSLDGLH